MKIASRAAAVERSCIIAGWNATIAQHQDTLRYSLTRGGAHHPKMRRYQEGDYVYVKYRTKPDSLHPQVRPEILRVLQVRKGKDGHDLVLRLQGRDGLTTDEHFSNCVPCHLPIEDESLQLGKVPIDFHCQQCGFPDDEKLLIMCDRCNEGWHTYCLEPKLLSVPEGNWYCKECAKHPEVLAAAKVVAVNLSPVAVPEKVAVERESLPGPSSTTKAKAGVEPVATHLPKGKAVRWANPEVVGANEPARNQQTSVKTRLQRKREVVETKSCIKAPTGRSTTSGVTNPGVPPGARVRVPREEPLRMVPAPVRKGQGTAVRYPHVFKTTEALEAYKASKVASSTDLDLMDLPHQWLLYTDAGAGDALRKLMPGDWTPAQILQLKEGWKMARCGKRRDNPPDRAKEAAAIHGANILKEAMDWGCIPTVLDSFAGQYSVATQLVRLAQESSPSISVHTNDQSVSVVANSHFDALQPIFYVYAKQLIGLDAVIISPPTGVLDMALPLAVRNAGMVVCCQVPMHYITQAHNNRNRWLRSLHDEERLFFIVTSRSGSSEGPRCVWVVVFKTKAISDWLRKPYAGYKRLLV